MTTRQTANRGASLHGLALTAGKSSSPRSKLPQEGKGSITPRPSMLSVASARMNTGMEIQNCAKRTGRKFGRTCLKTVRVELHPVARAIRRKSDSRRLRAEAQTTRSEDAHPSKPRRRNVQEIESAGEISSGNNARKVSSTNKSGNAIDKSAAARMMRCGHPPYSPANAPKIPAISVATKAAAGARNNDTRVP